MQLPVCVGGASVTHRRGALKRFAMLQPPSETVAGPDRLKVGVRAQTLPVAGLIEVAELFSLCQKLDRLADQLVNALVAGVRPQRLVVLGRLRRQREDACGIQLGLRVRRTGGHLTHSSTAAW